LQHGGGIVPGAARRFISGAKRGRGKSTFKAGAEAKKRMQRIQTQIGAVSQNTHAAASRIPRIGCKNPERAQGTAYFSFIFILAFFQKIRMFKIIGAV